MKFHRDDQRKKSRFLEEALPHRASLYRVCLGKSRDPSTAEDLVQETYKEAWKSFARYTPGSDCKAWLFRILFRVLGKYRTRSRRFKQVDLDEVPENKMVQESTTERDLAVEEILMIVRSLPEHHQTVLILADIEQFRYREIADMLEVPIGTVMSRLNRARELFREKYQQRLKTQSA